MPKYLEVAETAARAGAKILLAWQNRITAREKAPKDLVTEADVASQEEIRKILLGAFPDHDFVGEEDGLEPSQVRATSRFRWIVDPLDGTANYVHGLQSFAVSIALAEEGQIIAGLIYDPILDECYTAAVGEGAFCNGKPIRPSRCERLDQAMIAASFPPQVPRGSIEITRFIEVLHRCQSVRRLGSCALNLCYVACGRLDGYWTTCVKAWDAAAGILIVQEAGGLATDLDGGPFDLDRPEFIASASPTVHAELKAALQAVQ